MRRYLGRGVTAPPSFTLKVPSSGHRLGQLETLRGLAALAVVGQHITGAFNNEPAIWMVGSPFFVFINGYAAVVFFFVLSGYVLTIGGLHIADFRPILLGAIKRWPRLAGPVLLAVLFSWLLWQLGLFRHIEGAQVTGSIWLANFADGSPLPPELLTLGSALRQGSWATFLTGEHFYDSSLWTMQIEFFGSFIVFALAAGLILLHRHRGLQILLLATAAPVMHFFSPFYLAFWVGLALAWLDWIFDFKIPMAFGLILSAVGLYGLGYRASIDAYHWVPPVHKVYVNIIAAALLLFAATRCERIRRCLDVPLGRLLGRYSFPIYLLHVLILMSLGMLTFLLLLNVVGYGVAVAISLLSTILGTLAMAHLLATFEVWWIPIVHRAADWTLSAMASTPNSRQSPAAAMYSVDPHRGQ
jgi:peptidoglycan/LPS O-acetylase OafA/YrhL